jgi:hypothetical protein
MTDQNTNAGSTGGNSQGSNEQQQNQAPEWATNLQSSTEKLGNAVESLLRFAQQNAERQQQQGNRETTEVTAADVEEATQELDEATLETLPRGAFMRHLIERFNANLTTALKPINDQIEQTRNLAIASSVRNDTEKFAEKTPDFHEWRDEMIEITKQQPGLPIQRVYALARYENQGKARDLDGRYKDEQGKWLEAPLSEAEAKEKGKKEGTTPARGATQAQRRPAGNNRSGFNGLSPTGATETQRNQRMKPEDAASSAWEETVAKFGDPFA